LCSALKNLSGELHTDGGGYKVDNDLIAPMDDEIDSLRKSLKLLFPNLNDEELKAVEDLSRDRVANFRADRNKGGTKSAGKTRQTRVRMPSRVSAFLSNFVKAKNKKRRGCSQGWRTRTVAFTHICQPDLLQFP